MYRSVRFVMPLGWPAVVATLLAGCAAVSSADSADPQQWQGTWRLVDAIYDGELQNADMAWVVEGDHYRTRMDGRLQTDLQTFQLDVSRKRIDGFHHETPPGTYGGSVKGIYKISGDSLTVCYELTGQRYPKSFDAPRGSRQVLYHFRRE